MATVRQLTNVVTRALECYEQVRQLERMAGTPELQADHLAHRTAFRKAVEEICKLLECDPCDL